MATSIPLEMERLSGGQQHMGTPESCACTQTNSGILGKKEDKRDDTTASNSIPPFPSLYHFDMSSSSASTEQPRFRIVPIRMDDDEIKMAREEAGEPPEWAQATDRISPRSALAALVAHPHDPSAPREVINGLINNLRYQQEQSNNNIGELQVAMAGQQGLIDDLTQRLAEAEGAVDLD